jgi:transcriptional regulator with XRE-family HTH domain
MDQVKTGNFLKELRKEKNLTQEQLAEILGVSGRSVSRWETGNNMPDLTLLVEIADFYDVDVRELIEGERKSEMNTEEVKDVAAKMADYAESEKSKLLKTVRFISVAGVAMMMVAIIIQCLNFEAQSTLKIIGIATSFIAMLALGILALYVNGVLQKMVKVKALTIAIAVALIGMLIVAARYAFAVFVVFMFIIFDLINPGRSASGLAKYDKEAILEKYRSDLNSGLFLFPDDTDKIIDGEFDSKLKTGLLDTDGHLVLKAHYSHEDYEKEIERISGITCTISYKDMSVTNSVKYDTEMYNYPAYVAVDGYDYVYEYALLDEENDTIIYVLISYPKYAGMKKFKEYLKKDKSDYNLDNGKILENFTIYFHRFDIEDDPLMSDVYMGYEY